MVGAEAATGAEVGPGVAAGDLVEEAAEVQVAEEAVREAGAAGLAEEEAAAVQEVAGST